LQNSKWPEAVAICAVALAAVLILVPWEHVGPFDWNSLAALGTLATAIVAVAVPAWQNRQMKRSQMLRQLEIDWAIAHQGKWALTELRNALREWVNKSEQEPNSGQMLRMASQLDSLAVQTTDIFGLAVLALLSKFGRELAEPETPGRYVSRVWRSHGMAGITKDLSAAYILELETRLNQVSKDSDTWVELLMHRFAQLREAPPNFRGYRGE